MMNKATIIKLTFLGVLLYLGLLIANLPASQVIYRLLPNDISMSGVTGTIWQGKATRVYSQGVELKNVRWDVSVWRLFTGKLGLDIIAGNTRNRDEISIHGFAMVDANMTITAKNLNVRAPARLLAANVPMPMPIKLDGQLRVSLANAVFEAAVCQQLDGKGSWRDAAVSGTTGWIDLDTFTAVLGCQQQHITAEVAPPNSFNLSASAKISPSHQVTGSGKFKPVDSLPKEVKQAAMLFGAADQDGFYSFSF